MDKIIKHLENFVNNENLNDIISDTEFSIDLCLEQRNRGYDVKSLPVRYVSSESIEGLSNYYNKDITKAWGGVKHLSFERKGIVLTFMTH